jgi:multimeric flavodoxin WrbA
MCGDGWGTCIDKHTCSYGGNDYDEAREAVRQADMLCIITPVYWGEVAEGLKSFMDKLRRNENHYMNKEGILAGKKVLLAANAGGSGNGILSCLTQMERFCHHMGAGIYDFIGVNRWNAEYKKAAAYSAAKAMVSS